MPLLAAPTSRSFLFKVLKTDTQFVIQCREFTTVTHACKLRSLSSHVYCLFCTSTSVFVLKVDGRVLYNKTFADVNAVNANAAGVAVIKGGATVAVPAISAMDGWRVMVQMGRYIFASMDNFKITPL